MFQIKIVDIYNLLYKKSKDSYFFDILHHNANLHLLNAIVFLHDF